MDTPESSQPSRDAENVRALIVTVVVIALLITAGLVASQADGLIAAIGIGVEILIASAAAGTVLGFLFAVPRLLSQNPEAGAAAKRGGAKARFLESNTNLESISDWLTTMLVGVGISQLYQLNDALLSFRNYIAATAKVFHGSAGTLPAIAPLLLIIGAVSGFIAMYLYTRLNLAKLFNETEGFLRGEERRAVVSAARSLGPEGASIATSVAATGNVTSEDVLDVMFDLLYKPEGYRRVIDLGAQLAHSPIAKTATYWFYLAAAFGQQMNDALEAKDSALAASARTKALDAARRAVRIDRSYASRLWSISDPAGPDKDLASLRKDPDFLAVLGRAKSNG
jgi:hypothetical protein